MRSDSRLKESRVVVPFSYSPVASQGSPPVERGASREKERGESREKKRGESRDKDCPAPTLERRRVQSALFLLKASYTSSLS